MIYDSFVELGCVPVTLAQRFAGTHHPILVPFSLKTVQQDGQGVYPRGNSNGAVDHFAGFIGQARLN